MRPFLASVNTQNGSESAMNWLFYHCAAGQNYVDVGQNGIAWNTRIPVTITSSVQGGPMPNINLTAIFAVCGCHFLNKKEE
jgi:hypothetical protein